VARRVAASTTHTLGDVNAARQPAAVLFDSGGVLIQPIGGRWNPRADFEHTLAAAAPALAANDIAAAIAVGDAFLRGADSTPSYDDYHRVILGQLGVEPTAEVLAALTRPVDPRTILETFPEVLPTLRELRRRGVRMAVVSDAWPELPVLHEALGIDEFFEAYAISAELGCRKPDPLMYRYASDALGLPPEDCLFLDDDPSLVAAAIALGYQGLAVLRDPGEATDVVPFVRSIDALLSRF
jgi:putative hydrolase of the HAD superfamily